MRCSTCYNYTPAQKYVSRELHRCRHVRAMVSTGEAKFRARTRPSHHMMYMLYMYTCIRNERTCVTYVRDKKNAPGNNPSGGPHQQRKHISQTLVRTQGQESSKKLPPRPAGCHLCHAVAIMAIMVPDQASYLGKLKYVTHLLARCEHLQVRITHHPRSLIAR